MDHQAEHDLSHRQEREQLKEGHKHTEPKMTLSAIHPAWEVRLQLMRSCEEIDGAVVEQLGGIEYVRAADTKQLELNRLAKAAEKRRAMEVSHHFQMSLFGGAKALNEGLVHVLVLGFAIYLAVQVPPSISFGDVLTFPFCI